MYRNMYYGQTFRLSEGQTGLTFGAPIMNVTPNRTTFSNNPRLVQGSDKWYNDHMVTNTSTKLVPSTWPRHIREGRSGQLFGQFPVATGGAGEPDNSGNLRWLPSVHIPTAVDSRRPRDGFDGQSELCSTQEDFKCGSSHNNTAEPKLPMIKDVWRGNLDKEFARIRSLLPTYRYVAMDTEFPGVVIRNAPCYRNLEGNQLETIRKNVDVLKLIQLGISFFDENGCTPPGTSTWQFNFKFNIKEDRCAQSSIDLLQEAGMQFERHVADGIDPEDFCYLFFTSGLVLQEDVSWLTYHGGYDFGYLMRILRGQNLPSDPEEILDCMRTYFPTCYDVKVLLHANPLFIGGLHDTAVRLGLKRIGSPHQAGSDSLLTGKAFFKIKEKFYEHTLAPDSDLDKYNGKIYGFEKLDDCLSLASTKPQDMELLGLDTNECSDTPDSECTDSYTFPRHSESSVESTVGSVNSSATTVMATL